MRGKTIQQTLRSRVDSLVASSDSERLRLALNGAQVAVFDWTIADDRIVWDGAASLLHLHPEPDRPDSGQAFRTWLGPEARGQLLSFIDDPAPTDPSFLTVGCVQGCRVFFLSFMMYASSPELCIGGIGRQPQSTCDRAQDSRFSKSHTR